MFYGKTHEQPWKVLILEKKSEAPWCFSGAENRGSLALVLCVCSCAEEKLQQRVRRKIAATGFYTA